MQLAYYICTADKFYTRKRIVSKEKGIRKKKKKKKKLTI